LRWFGVRSFRIDIGSIWPTQLCAQAQSSILSFYFYSGSCLNEQETLFS
jgi:hypothetical protein